MHDKILILDFGSQLTQLIARRIREANVYCEIFPYDVDPERIKNFSAKGIILSGGPESVTEKNTPRIPQIVFDLGLPLLGICYGMQAMAHQLGGEVAYSAIREFGYAEIQTHGYLLDGLNALQEKEIEEISAQSLHTKNKNTKGLQVWMSHGDKVIKLPSGFQCMASTESCAIAAMAEPHRHYYGLQFHPEVTHTLQGTAMLKRFVLDICACKPDWKMSGYIEEAVALIQKQVGKEQVILGLSGGVDSSVAAALIHRAIGEQLTCVFVDNGLLRLNEAEQVMQTFQQHLGVRVVHVDAGTSFMNALAGTSDPEAKRKIIGKKFEHEKLEFPKDLGELKRTLPTHFPLMFSRQRPIN